MNFISYLSNKLVSNKEIHDLSRNIEYSPFDFIGFRKTITALNLIALVNADNLTEKELISIRDKFFDITESFPKEFDIKTKLKPNGLLCFVFEHGCPSKQLVKFIQNLTKISPWAGGVVVTWLIDCEETKIYTHKNPVSMFPPVVILPESAYPGLKYIEGFLSGYSKQEQQKQNEQMNGNFKKENEQMKNDTQRTQRTQSNWHISILHLSDIQYGCHHTDKDIKRKPIYPDTDHSEQLRKIKADLDTLKADNINPNFIVMTGDIAERSLPNEYELAEDFLGGIADHLNLDRRYVIIIPGNHDINRKLCQAARLTAESMGEPFDPPYFQKFKLYAEFFKKFYKNVSFPSNVKPYNFSREELFVNSYFPDENVVFAGLNSCIDESEKKPHYGNITVEQLKKAVKSLDEYDPDKKMLRIALMHHNFVRYPDYDNENLKDAEELEPILLDSGFHMILHGHRHITQSKTVGSPNAVIYVLATGSAGLDSETLPENSRRYQVIDIQDNQVKIYRRRFDNTKFHNTGKGCWTADPFPGTNALYESFPLTNLTPNSNSFARKSAPKHIIKHNPYKNRGRLPYNSDMFFGRTGEIRRIESFLNKEHWQCVSIVGERKIGKSSLAFRIFHRIMDYDDTISVYLDCDGLPEECNSKDEFFQILNRKFLDYIEDKPEIREHLAGYGDNLFKNYSSFEGFISREGRNGLKFIIFMDEFEHLPDKDFADDTFFSNLRSMAYNSDNRLGYVTVSQSSLKDLTHKSIKTSGFWNIFTPVMIGLLDGNSIDELRRHGFEKNNLSLEKGEKKMIEYYGGAFPFFNQIVCEHVFDAKLDVSELDTDALETELRPHYETIWEGRAEYEKKLLKNLKSGDDNSSLQDMKTRGLLIKENETYHLFSEFFLKFLNDLSHLDDNVVQPVKG
ncbi:MAG: hypothetical protein GY749_17505 [Desulfobacteraceae bacterium]|nr:hypothetical protein [Desulfobacteraceae bacterium]